MAARRRSSAATTARGLAAALLALALLHAPPAGAAPRKDFNIAWSIYVGYMPWPWLDETGILKKWADKYGIAIKLTEVNDYVESVNQYTAGAFDGVATTDMDCLSIPSAGGVDSTALIIGDYSNGNDAVILKDAPGAHPALADIKGRHVNLVQLSVSEYLLSRALDSIGMAERDVTLVNTSDADMVAAFQTPDAQAVVTWNPQVTEILKDPRAHKVFDSSQIPGEIIDILAVNTKTLADNPALGKALAGAWFEALKAMTGDSPAAVAARTRMAALSGADLASFEGQLKTTRLYTDPAEATAFADSPDLVKTMQLVRTFGFAHGLLGQDAKSVDVVGIAFPGGRTLGDKANIKMRFDDRFMKMAADGAL